MEEMTQERGYILAEWAFMIEKDADFMQAYDKLYKKALTDGKALPARIREPIAMAIFAYRGPEATHITMPNALKHSA